MGWYTAVSRAGCGVFIAGEFGMRRILLSLAALAFVAAQFGSAHGEASVVKGSLKCDEQGDCYISDMEIHGEIDNTTVEQVSNRVDELHKVADLLKKPIHPFKVSLDSPGGSISAAMKIGRLLRRESMGAEIAMKNPPNEGHCVSACVLIKLAGRNTETKGPSPRGRGRHKVSSAHGLITGSIPARAGTP
jgi:membrane-bound ClpP family serine protease